MLFKRERDNFIKAKKVLNLEIHLQTNRVYSFMSW